MNSQIFAQASTRANELMYEADRLNASRTLSEVCRARALYNDCDQIIANIDFLIFEVAA